MADYIQQALTTLTQSAPNWLQDVQYRGQQVWQSHLFPGRKTEAWKYTSLRDLETGDYNRIASPQVLDAALAAQTDIVGLGAVQLVFVNGVLNESLSDNLDSLPHGVELVTFSRASAQQQQVIAGLLDKQVAAEKHLFSALNSAVVSDGVFLKVGENTRFEQPVCLVYVNTCEPQPYTVNTRLLVVLEANAEATVVEHYTEGEPQQNGFTNSVTELNLAENARLNHYRLQLEDESAIHVGNVNTGLQRGAHLNGFYLGFGGKIKRIDSTVNYLGEGADCEINGIYLTRNSQHIDYHTCIEHAVPHCTSNETFRGIVGDSSRAVFSGRIHIHPKAQKTLAQLSNKNLLTSNKAEVDTKPELEIYADDVQCAHGATVAQLDNTAMHYLRTRGVSEAEARMMLSFGFINELVNGIKHTAIAEFVRPMLVDRFCRDEKLVRHLG